MYRKNNDLLKIFGIVFAVIFCLALTFCAVVCVWSAVKGLTFGEVIKSWKPVKDVAETTAHLIFKI